MMSQGSGFAPGVISGEPRLIRGDEFLTSTPILLGYIAAHGTSALTPLAQTPDVVHQIPSSGVFESVVFFDGSLLRLLSFVPDQMLFAAFWWLPSLLLMLCLPPWMQRLGASRIGSWLATGLVFVAPSVAWWSMTPIRVMAFTLAGCLLLIRGYDTWVRRPWLGFSLCVLAGILWSRVVSNYVPWAIVLSIPIVLATVSWLLFHRRGRKFAVKAAVTTCLSALVMLAGLVFDNWAALVAQSDTVYPGARRVTGAILPAANMFAGPFLRSLQDNSAATGIGQSDMSQAFTVCAVWALVLWVGLPQRKWSRRSIPIAMLGVSTAFWLSWCLLDWGGLGAHLPIVNRVVPIRAAQTVGILATILLGFVISRVPRAPSARIPLTAAVSCGAATAIGGSSLSAVFMPSVGPKEIFLCTVIVGILVGLLTAFPRSGWLAALGVGCAALVVVGANPIQVGLGDLRNSSTAQKFMAIGVDARRGHELWATDSKLTAALLTATGVPQLGGNQVTGPVAKKWQQLDPSSQYKEIWNRGVSAIIMRWTTDSNATISLGAARDQIIVSVDPCALPAKGFNLTHIVSEGPLPNGCLISNGTFEWNGAEKYIYAIN
nr:hypothetical protein [Antricoccus suffuscus]